MFRRPDWLQIKDLRDHQLDNRMESFFLAETVKYLYLLFDPANFLHGGETSGITSWEAGGEGGQCVLGAGGIVFNTEAHPLDPAALYCCSQHSQDHQELQDLLLSLSQTSGGSDNHAPPGQSESIALKPSEKQKTPPPLSCPVQPFWARLSLLGQVFTDRSWHIIWPPDCRHMTRRRGDVTLTWRQFSCVSGNIGATFALTVLEFLTFWHFSLTLKDWKCFCLFKYWWSDFTWLLNYWKTTLIIFWKRNLFWVFLISGSQQN